MSHPSNHMTKPLFSAMIATKLGDGEMALKVKRQDDLDAMFGKFAQLDPKDEKRDKFLKRDEAHKDIKKAKPLLQRDNHVEK